MSETAFESAAAEEKGQKPTLDFDGESYTIERKPNTLLIAELARTSTEGPEAVGVIADFFQAVLGSEYPRFRKHFFTSEAAEDEAVIGSLIGQVLEKMLGRPTE